MSLFGLDHFIRQPELREICQGRRVALLAHPASLSLDFKHALDCLMALKDINLSAAFGPQHGLKGDKQDNMVESEDYFDRHYSIPIYSLYGKVRRPTKEMLDSFEVLLIDLQDLGCRIYTFATTLCYLLDAAAAFNKTIIVLDRPNPIGRPIEGLILRQGWHSFVGAAKMPMRHGLTLGELGLWYRAKENLAVNYHVIKFSDLAADAGWPEHRVWVNPSPNAPNVYMARSYAGTVMLEGTTLSEGRGTTRPLELFGAPDLDNQLILNKMYQLAPQWLNGCKLRPCWFEPTFHKHQGKLCAGLQIHPQFPFYQHQEFKPWRLQALAFKAIRLLYPDYPLWRDFPYEYETEKLAIDVINGSPILRLWVDQPDSSINDLEELAALDERTWRDEVREFYLY